MKPRVLWISGTNKLYLELEKLGYPIRAIISPNIKSNDSEIEWTFFKNPEQDIQFIKNQIHEFNPDVIVQSDNSSPLVHLQLESFHIPKIWYCIDTHLHRWHEFYTVLFDKVLYAHHNFAENINAFNKNVEWFPLYFNGSSPFIPWKHRQNNLTFVGNMRPKLNPNRIAFFESLKQKHIDVNVLQGDFIGHYQNSKMGINQSVNKDLNSRFFEIMGCGSLLLNDDIGFLNFDLFKDGEDFFIYQNIEHLQSILTWVKSNEDLAEKIAFNGFQKISKAHTIQKRALDMAQQIDSLLSIKTPKRLSDFEETLKNFAFLIVFDSDINAPRFKSHLFTAMQQHIKKYSISFENNLHENWFYLIKAFVLFQLENPRDALSAIQGIDLKIELPIYLEHFFRNKIVLECENQQFKEAKNSCEKALAMLPGFQEFENYRQKLSTISS